MYTVTETVEFRRWLEDIWNRVTRTRLFRRMYFCKRGNTIIVMLGGGNKSSQMRDIAQAKALARGIEHDAD